MAALISFVAGLFGYIIARYWVRPIGLYHRHKRRLALDLEFYAGALNRAGAREIVDQSAQARLQSARKALGDLLSAYDGELPQWYRLVLARRSESPMAANQPLMALANIRNPEHAAKRLNEVLRALRIEVRPFGG
jgi:hypothetical protein